MTVKGMDYSFWRPTQPSQLNGFEFVSRYLSNTPSKNLSAAEAKQLTAWGKQIVSNWESTGKGGDRAQGQQDAQRALAQAHAAEMPAGRPIYFSIDEDVEPSTTEQYRLGIASVMPIAQIGVYGSAAVCQWWRAKGCGWAWRTMSTGWRGGSSTAGCQVEQTTKGSTKNYDVDFALVGDYGGWTVGSVPPPPPPPPPPPSNDNTRQWRAQHNTYTPLAVDGVWGSKTTQALQYVLGVPVDGDFGPQSTRAFQALLGVEQNDDFGKPSVEALQRRVGAVVDGDLGPQTIGSMQSALNHGALY